MECENEEMVVSPRRGSVRGRSMSCQPKASRVCMVSVCPCEDQRLNVVLAGVPVSRVLKDGGKGGSATVCAITLRT